MSVIDFNKARFDAAKDASDTKPVDALREALRRVEDGELDPSDVIVTLLLDEGEDDSVQCIHGGPATKNARMGMLFRAQNMLLPGGVE